MYRIVTSTLRRSQRSRSDSRSEAEDAEFTQPTIQVISNRILSRQLSAPSETTQQQHQHQHQHQQQQQQSFPLLYALCKRWAWPAITFRAASHPEEVSAEFKEKNGDNMLHWVCFGHPPIEAVTALVRACPELAFSPNREGLFPLHVAASYRASADVIRVLVEAYPTAASTPSVGGSYPLHYMCDYGCSIASLRVLLETDEGASSVFRRDKTFHRTPLYILNSRKDMNLFHHSQSTLRRTRKAQNLLRRQRRDDAEDEAESRAEIQRIEDSLEGFRQLEFWRKAALLIHAEHQNHKLSDIQRVDDNIVNACVSIAKCPPTLMEQAMLLYPWQCREVNQDGDCPLHIAVARNGDSMMYDILSVCPEAACVRNARGELPVQVAIDSERRWSNGVGALLAAYPVGVESLRLDERLYPLLWAKISHGGGVAALFESIQAKPSLFQ